MFKIHHSKPIVYGVIVAATCVVGTARSWGGDGVLSKTPAVNGSYCHLKFPAIRSSTLETDHPQSKSSSTGDLVDYYGPCDHDPLGPDEVQREKHDSIYDWEVNYGG
jgi:hypothetical protein